MKQRVDSFGDKVKLSMRQPAVAIAVDVAVDVVRVVVASTFSLCQSIMRMLSAGELLSDLAKM